MYAKVLLIEKFWSVLLLEVIIYVAVEGRNQTLFTLSTFEKKKVQKAGNFNVKH